MSPSGPLRVCIVTRVVNQHAFGGMQQHTEDLMRGLAAAGHDVTVLTPRLADEPPAPPGPGTVRWAFADVDRQTLAYTHEWGAASSRLFAALHAERPFDVVHSESAGALGLVKAGQTRGVPFVVAFHGNLLGYVRAQARAALSGRPQPNAFARSVRRTLRVTAQHTRHGNWTAYRDAEAIVVSDAHVGDTVRSHMLRRERTHVVPNGVDVHEYRPGRAEDLRERWGVPSDAPLLLTLGRLARDKGNDVALHALASLPEPFLVIAGDGEERGPLERLAVRLGVSDRVRLIGAVPQPEVPRAMAAADVFWFPTVRDEAAPLVLPQAMAAGLPVVASRIGGIPDYVSRPGEQALLVAPGDATVLADATRPLLADPGLRARLGAAARERVVEEFSLERMIERTVEVYRVAIARTAGVPATV